MNRRSTPFVRVASGVLHLLLLLGCSSVIASQLLAAGIRVTEMPAGNLNFMLSGRVSCSFYFPGPNGNSVIQGLASEFQIESDLSDGTCPPPGYPTLPASFQLHVSAPVPADGSYTVRWNVTHEFFPTEQYLASFKIVNGHLVALHPVDAVGSVSLILMTLATLIAAYRATRLN